MPVQVQPIESDEQRSRRLLEQLALMVASGLIVNWIAKRLRR